jgi:hypothetical protein
VALTASGADASFLSFVVPKAAGCVPLPGNRATTIAVYGGVIAAVGRVDHEASTQPRYLEVERGAYGEASQAIQHALGAPQLLLSSFGAIESPISSDITLSFGEGVEITS